jgi:serine/threonine protein kinase
MELFGSAVSTSSTSSQAPALLSDSPESFQSEKGFPVCFERLPSADLFDFIDSNPIASENSIKLIFTQLAHTILYLHQNGIVHRDIKDENIVIDLNLNVKLIDFGSADRIPSSHTDYFTSFRGTKRYISPELLESLVHRGPEVDVWSLGIVLYTLAFGSPPFHTLEDIKYQRYAPSSTLRSRELLTLITEMLHPKPESRATMEQVCLHPWMIM